MGNLLIGSSADGMAFTHTVAHRAATVNAPATSSKNEFATSVDIALTSGISILISPFGLQRALE
jgi:hypothetical protein